MTLLRAIPRNLLANSKPSYVVHCSCVEENLSEGHKRTSASFILRLTPLCTSSHPRSSIVKRSLSSLKKFVVTNGLTVELFLHHTGLYDAATASSTPTTTREGYQGRQEKKAHLEEISTTASVLHQGLHRGDDTAISFEQSRRPSKRAKSRCRGVVLDGKRCGRFPPSRLQVSKDFVNVTASNSTSATLWDRSMMWTDYECT